MNDQTTEGKGVTFEAYCYHYEDGQWLDDPKAINLEDALTEITVDPTKGLVKPPPIKGWEEEPFFRIGAPYKIGQPGFAFLSVHHNEDTETQAADQFLVQLWLGSYLQLVLIKQRRDLMKFLSEMAPVVHASIASQERIRQLKIQDNLRNLRDKT
jgi:hypothetical protein